MEPPSDIGEQATEGTFERPGARAAPSLASERILAFFEVVLCSDYPTQILIGAGLFFIGMSPTTDDGSLSLRYVVALSLVDTLALIGLIIVILRAHGERPAAVLLGSGQVSVRREIGLGIVLIPAAFLVAALVLGLILQLAPSLHTVPENPLKSLMRSPAQAAIFAVVVVIAGGVREELQRAFLMSRFDRWLGGPGVGVGVTSIAFGAGHLTQGVDASVATAALGAFWAMVYMRRRSAVAPMVSHGGFNLLQLVQFVILGQ